MASVSAKEKSEAKTARVRSVVRKGKKTSVAAKSAPVQKEEDQLVLAVQKNSRPERFFEAVGRRKTAVARVRLFTKGDHAVTVNNRTFESYFPSPGLQDAALASLKKMKILDKFRVVVLVRGGGIHAQAEAMRHASARALVNFNPDFRKRLKRVGYLRRDARMVERKKYGLKKARRAPQWAKR